MINNPELIKQIIDNIKKLSKEDLDKVMKKTNEWYNKEVTDTNVGNIEEDIERCKELIKPVHINWIGGMNQNAIKILLGNLEALSDMQDSANREIKELESKLEEANKQLDLDYVDENYIPKQKIINKIQEIKEDKDSYYYYTFLEERDIEKIIQILEELLQEE